MTDTTKSTVYSLMGTVAEPHWYGNRRWRSFSQLGWSAFLLLILAGVSIAGIIVTNGIAVSPRNLSNLILQQLPIILIVPFAALLWSRGGFDMSVAATMSLGSLILAMQGNPWTALGLVVLVTTIQGTSLGLLSMWWKVPGIILSLMVSFGTRALVLGVSGGQSIILEGGWVHDGTMVLLGCILILVMLVTIFFINYFKQEHTFVALVLPWTLSAMAAGTAGMYLATRLERATPTIGTGSELDLVLVLLASGSPFGSRKINWSGLVLAALVLAVVRNSVSLIGVDVPMQWTLLIAGTTSLAIIHAIYHSVLGRIYRKRQTNS